MATFRHFARLLMVATIISTVGVLAMAELSAPAHGQVNAENPETGPAFHSRPWPVSVMVATLYVIIGLVCVYIIRHYWFTLDRLFYSPRQPYVDIDTAAWPPVTVLIPSHNEESVIGDILDDLLEADYPRDRLTIVPINDRSGDNTGAIIDEYARAHPEIIKPFHRTGGKPGKAAALRDATAAVEDDVMLVFDADYLPGTGVIKQLVAPFFDPEVGAVMGRVVPHNVGVNLLTRLLDLERSGGYQVDQQARMNMRLVPQYGGTVGGVRRAALESVGGWCEDCLAEDTDATYRLLIGGWKTVYQNRTECYEQVPDTWPMRIRQIARWAQGHNQTLWRHVRALLFSRRTTLSEKLDGLLLLGVYLMAPTLVLGWLLGIILWFMGEFKASVLLILVVTSYGTLGNYAIFFEVAAATYLDGTRQRVRLLPFVFLGFLVSLFSITRATLWQIGHCGRNDRLLWNKTARSPGRRHV